MKPRFGRINWDRVRLDVGFASIPDHVRDAFDDTGDVGAFRVACRAVKLPEDIIDFAVMELER